MALLEGLKKGLDKSVRTIAAAGTLAGAMGGLPANNLSQFRPGVVEASGTPRPPTPDELKYGRLSVVTSWNQDATERGVEAEPQQPLDYPLRPPELEGSLSPDVPVGWFYEQTKRPDQPKGMGFEVSNGANAPMWDIYKQFCEREKLGFPITRRYTDQDGKVIQLFQNGGIEYNPKTGEKGLVNSFDIIGKAGNNLSEEWYRVPGNFPWNEDAHPEFDTRQFPEWNGQGSLTGTKQGFHIEKVFSKKAMPGAKDEQIKALKDAYLATPDWLQRYGLPLAGASYFNDAIGGTVFSVKGQRYALEWRQKPMPGSTEGNTVVIMSGSQILRDLSLTKTGLVPLNAIEARYNDYGVGGHESPQQIMNIKLQALLDYTFEENGIKYPNALGLNEQEVKGYIAGTWGEADIKSFKVLKNIKGDPLAILVTGGKYGLKTEKPNIANIQAAITRLNQIDPDTFDQLTNGFGLRAITGEVAPGTTFTNHPGYGSTWTFLSYILQLNEKASEFPVTHALATILNESRGMYHDPYMINGKSTAPDRLNDIRGIDKGMWLRQWTEQHQAQLTPDEYTELTTWADIVIKLYNDAAKKTA